VMDVRRNQTGRVRRIADVDMTTMVDVTFLLLIFFMLTASFNLQKSIEFPRQQSENNGPAIDPREDKVSLQVDQHGSFLLMTPHWELQTPGKHKLTAALKTATAESSTPLQLSVEVHEQAKLKALVAALDAGAAAGFADIRVTQFDHL
jgi:biopolymer transport protein ExbD